LSRQRDDRAEWGRKFAEQRLLWFAFAFAVGIALYTLLPEEPDFYAVSALFGASGLFVLNARYRSRLTPAGIVVFAVIAGAFVADLRTTVVDAPRLQVERTFTIIGLVTNREDTQRGPRLTIDVEDVADLPRNLPKEQFPQRVRISVPDTTVSGIGDAVTVRARLFPPSGPVRPGGYDFSFRAYFERIGATGFSYGVPRSADLGEPSLIMKAERKLGDLRQEIAVRINGLLGAGDGSALAAALLVGDRSGLSAESEDALRQAGLAHILAISGLHMALFAGGTYAVILIILSLSQTAALHYPTHRIAAAAALMAAICYLGLSGASVATQRSFIMVFLVFLGILTGRRGLTLRSVALAGLALLLLAPERLFHPGFQMSFAAVICLVAAYDALRDGRGERLPKARSASPVLRGMMFVLHWTFGLFLTALIAGTATGLIGAYHFGRIAPFGLIGNMLGMPVFSLIVMPMGVLALILMPFGLAVLPLQVMAFGLDLLLRIADWTAGLGAHSGAVPVPDAITTLLATATLFGLLLLPGKLKGLSAIPFVAAVITGTLSRPPDVQIADKGRLIAARDDSGTLLIHAGRAGFATDNWLQVEGLPEKAFQAHRMAEGQFACDGTGCLYRAYPYRTQTIYQTLFGLFDSGEQGTEAIGSPPLLLALPKTADALDLDCRFADVIVTTLTVPDDCRAGLVIDRRNRHALGAISIWLAPPEKSAKPGHTEISQWRAAKTSPPRPWHK
jgi:competence protein ComEC